MQIPSNPYPVVRTPPALPPRREDVRAEDEAATVSVSAPSATRRDTAPASATNLPVDMQRVALRGRPAEGGTSYSNRQALAEYTDIAQRNAGDGQIEVLRFEAYA